MAVQCNSCVTMKTICSIRNIYERRNVGERRWNVNGTKMAALLWPFHLLNISPVPSTFRRSHKYTLFYILCFHTDIRVTLYQFSTFTRSNLKFDI